jgi:hypothetical protein
MKRPTYCTSIVIRPNSRPAPSATPVIEYYSLFRLFMLSALGMEGIFLFAIASKSALGPYQSCIYWVLGTLSLGVMGY